MELATGRAHHISYRGEAAKAESNIGVPYIVAVATESLLHLLLVSRGPRPRLNHAVATLESTSPKLSDMLLLPKPLGGTMPNKTCSLEY
jgi:hypothetical protein